MRHLAPAAGAAGAPVSNRVDGAHAADTAIVQLELDRLSFGFQRFVCLHSSRQIPDRTTIWPFRERLIHANASASIFEAVVNADEISGYSRCPTSAISNI
jgi:hypothetical protein